MDPAGLFCKAMAGILCKTRRHGFPYGFLFSGPGGARGYRGTAGAVRNREEETRKGL